LSKLSQERSGAQEASGRGERVDSHCPASDNPQEDAALDNKRRFRRTPFDVGCVLQRGESRLELQLINVSFNGALTRAPAASSLPLGTDGTLRVQLHPSREVISAEVELVHREDDLLGFRIRNIDINSLSHLRRLIEMNSGSDVVEELPFLRADRYRVDDNR
jgi:hypothetical protein